ncbi:HAD family hydrolase [Flaviaesturariibacter amylovorans]|uniref:HAD family hydrolase n=1 Tax=Flaviaesturariibacter amylovorans TaxID=1084520 RepID=A0ABP8HQH7_9BACT
MRKKALILDLDNTIYPASAITATLFAPLYDLIQKSGEYQGTFEDVQARLLRQPFQVVAQACAFSETLTQDGIRLLSTLTWNEKMEPFEDYASLRTLSCKKFLVTTGFTALQHSKIAQLGIENDFEALFVVDPTKTERTKQDVFQQILSDYGLEAGDVLVVGDDPHSEIAAATALGIDTLLYQHAGTGPRIPGQETIHSFADEKLRRFFG